MRPMAGQLRTDGELSLCRRHAPSPTISVQILNSLLSDVSDPLGCCCCRTAPRWAESSCIAREAGLS